MNINELSKYIILFLFAVLVVLAILLMFYSAQNKRLERENVRLSEMVELRDAAITEIDKKSFKFLIYLNNELIGTSSIIKLKDREYKLNSINIDEKYKQIFLDDLKKELFQRFNPYTFIE